MRLSLRYKAVVLIAVTEIALLGLLLASNLNNTRDNLETQLANQARATAELVAASATGPLLALDLAQLRHLLTGVINKHNMTYVSIRDHSGKILAAAGKKSQHTQPVRASETITVAGSLFGTIDLELTRQQAEAALATTTRSNVSIVALEVILVALISFTLGWFLTRNINKVAKAAEEVAAGNYAVRVPVNSRDEIGDLASSFNDMTEKLRTNLEALKQSNRRFRDMADNTSDWLWETDTAGCYTYVSNKVMGLTGYEPHQIIGTSAFEIMLPEDAERLRTTFKMLSKDRKSFYGVEYHVKHKTRGEVIFESNGTPILDNHGMVVGYRGVTRDITRRKQDQSRLLYLAEYDALTGLLGRHKFIDTLDNEIRLSSSNNTPLTILFFDLDGFKLINDTHGHMAGDGLLRIVADIFSTHIGNNAVLARLGGDEFGILLRGATAEIGRKVAKDLLAAIETTPLAVGETAVRLFAGVGICSYPEGGQDSETLLAHADSAVTLAKAHGQNRYHVYHASDTLLDNMRDRINWQTLIHEALENNRLRLDFQSIVPLASREHGMHYEALIRLTDITGKEYTASEFIETAEHTGQISDIDKWVLTQVLKRLSLPENKGCTIAINLSGRSLDTPGLFDFFQKRVIASKIKSSQLIFEITESSAVAEMAKAESFLSRMKKLGYHFSLDDFGVGFSSFSYLKHLPVDQIKIDGSFIRHIDYSREDQIFVKAMVQVAHELGLSTVAEFVESPGILEILADIGVDYVQGHHIGKPSSTLTTPNINFTGSPVAGHGNKPRSSTH